MKSQRSSWSSVHAEATGRNEIGLDQWELYECEWKRCSFLVQLVSWQVAATHRQNTRRAHGGQCTYLISSHLKATLCWWNWFVGSRIEFPPARQLSVKILAIELLFVFFHGADFEDLSEGMCTPAPRILAKISALSLMWITYLMYSLGIVWKQMTQPLGLGGTRCAPSVRSPCPQRRSRPDEASHVCKPHFHYMDSCP